MPYAWVEPAVAFEIDQITIHHVHKDDLAEMPVLDYWYSYEGEEIDVRELEDLVDPEDPSDHEEIFRLAIRGRVGPFADLPAKQTFTVRRLVDAYQEYYVDVEASSPEEALELSEDMEFAQGSVIEFDATRISVLDDMGDEVLEIPE